MWELSKLRHPGAIATALGLFSFYCSLELVWWLVLSRIKLVKDQGAKSVQNMARIISETVVTMAVLGLSAALMLHGVTGTEAATANGAIWAILAYWFTRAGHALGSASATTPQATSPASGTSTTDLASAVVSALAQVGQAEAGSSTSSGSGATK